MAATNVAEINVGGWMLMREIARGSHQAAADISGLSLQTCDRVARMFRQDIEQLSAQSICQFGPRNLASLAMLVEQCVRARDLLPARLERTDCSTRVRQDLPPGNPVEQADPGYESGIEQSLAAFNLCSYLLIREVGRMSVEACCISFGLAQETSAGLAKLPRDDIERIARSRACQLVPVVVRSIDVYLRLTLNSEAPERLRRLARLASVSAAVIPARVFSDSVDKS